MLEKLFSFSWIENIQDYLVRSLPHIEPVIIQFVLAMLVLKLGWSIINRIEKNILKVLRFKKLEDATIQLVTKSADLVLKVLLIITVISMLGVKMVGIITALGSVGLAIALSLQGSLKNLAAGMLIVVFKPIKIGDKVSIASYTGRIREINILYSTIETFDSVYVTIPNENIMNGAISNWDVTEKTRVRVTVGIGYEDDIDKARSIMLECVASLPEILSDPAPIVIVNELADSSVNLELKAWVYNADYTVVMNQLYELIKVNFDKQNVNIPYPQRDVHMISSEH